jgi:hypothetical protein
VAQDNEREICNRRSSTRRLEPTVPDDTRGPGNGTRAAKNEFELAREGWRGTKTRRRRRGKRGEQAILGRAAGISKPSRKLPAVPIMRCNYRNVYPAS